MKRSVASVTPGVERNFAVKNTEETDAHVASACAIEEQPLNMTPLLILNAPWCCRWMRAG